MTLTCECGATLCELCGKDINVSESTIAEIGGGERLVHKNCLEGVSE